MLDTWMSEDNPSTGQGNDDEPYASHTAVVPASTLNQPIGLSLLHYPLTPVR